MKKNNDLYVLPKYVSAFSRADQAFWMKDGAIAFLVIALSLLDAVTLYTVFDTVMYQSQIISIILTVGCAISLNFIPLIAARFIHYYRYHMNGVKLWMLIALGAVFLILFSATFYLRWETRDLSFSGAETTMVDSTRQAAGIQATDSDSQEGVAITILLGIMPFITSAINLALGYLNDDPVKEKLNALRLERSKLLDSMNVMTAAKVELEQDWEEILSKLDASRLGAVCESVQQSTELIKATARLDLAEKLRDPNSISRLTEPKLMDD